MSCHYSVSNTQYIFYITMPLWEASHWGNAHLLVYCCTCVRLGLRAAFYKERTSAPLRVTSYISVHCPKHHVHPTETIQQALGSRSILGGNLFSGGRSLGAETSWCYWFPTAGWTSGQAFSGPAPRGCGGGHGRVRGEGLFILVAWSCAGRLQGRALISTNRFLIRASQALHPPPHTHTLPHGHKYIQHTNCSQSEPTLTHER